jgi:hypothetical protein
MLYIAKTLQPWTTTVLLLTLTCCRGEQRDESFFDWHKEKQAVEIKVQELMDAPDGIDCPAIINIYRTSGWPEDIVKLKVGGTIIGCYDNLRVSKKPVESVEQGLQLMEQAALSDSEAGQVTPQRLRMFFERSTGTQAGSLKPNPQLAACWMAAEKITYTGKPDKKAAQHCIDLRKHLTVSGQ